MCVCELIWNTSSSQRFDCVDMYILQQRKNERWLWQKNWDGKAYRQPYSQEVED